jgi:hypothetical protein
MTVRLDGSYVRAAHKEGFFRDVLGMEVIGGSAPDHRVGATAFLSSRPDEEPHGIALFGNPAFAHVAFEVSYSPSWNIPIKFLANHGYPSPFILTTLTAT